MPPKQWLGLSLSPTPSPSPDFFSISFIRSEDTWP